HRASSGSSIMNPKGSILQLAVLVALLMLSGCAHDVREDNKDQPPVPPPELPEAPARPVAEPVPPPTVQAVAPSSTPPTPAATMPDRSEFRKFGSTSSLQDREPVAASPVRAPSPAVSPDAERIATVKLSR